jgi:hypothetical protein
MQSGSHAVTRDISKLNPRGVQRCREGMVRARLGLLRYTAAKISCSLTRLYDLIEAGKLRSYHTGLGAVAELQGSRASVRGQSASHGYWPPGRPPQPSHRSVSRVTPTTLELLADTTLRTVPSPDLRRPQSASQRRSRHASAESVNQVNCGHLDMTSNPPKREITFNLDGTHYVALATLTTSPAKSVSPGQ